MGGFSFDAIQVGGLSSYLVSLSTLSNDVSQCQIFSTSLGALVYIGLCLKGRCSKSCLSSAPTSSVVLAACSMHIFIDRTDDIRFPRGLVCRAVLISGIRVATRSFYWAVTIHPSIKSAIDTAILCHACKYPTPLPTQYFSKPGDTFLVLPGRRNATACLALRRLGLPCAALPGQARRTQTHALGR